MPDLPDLLERHGATLARRPIAEMYAADPFWERRFGPRGRRYADEDGRHHVTYLVESLREGDPARLVRYAGWLRRVLVSRGMCTRHALENLARLGAAVRDAAADAGADPAPALAHLAAADAALRYPGRPAGHLAAAADALAGAAAAALAAAAADADALRRTLADLAWYLADAADDDRTDLLAAHLAWLGGDGRDAALPPVHALAAALAGALDRVPLPADVRADAAARLAAARPDGAAPPA